VKIFRFRSLGAFEVLLLKATSLIFVVLTISACSTLKTNGDSGQLLYNKTKHDLYKDANTTYSKAKIEQVVDDNLENQNQLLTKSLELVNSKAEIQLERKLLLIASSSNSIGYWYENMIGPNLAELVDSKAHQLRLVDSEAEKKKVAQSMLIISKIPKFKGVPDCRDKGLKKLKSWIEEKSLTANSFAKSLMSTCEAFKIGSELVSSFEGQMRGALKTAVTAKKEAVGLLDADIKALAKSSQKVKAAKKARDDADKKVKEKPGVQKWIDEQKKSVKKYQENLSEAKNLLKTFGVDALENENIKSIGILLQAFGNGEFDDSSENKDLSDGVKKAATVLSKLPALASEAAAIIESGKKPNVSSLLIELNHQKILNDRDRQHLELSRRSVAFHEQKGELLFRSADHLRKVRNRLCRFAVLKSIPNHGPEDAPKDSECATFEISFNQKKVKSCSYKKISDSGDSKVNIPDCALKTTWQKAFADKKSTPLLKRQIYGAVYNYAESLKASTEATGIDFKLIDNDHRITAVANRSALQAWNNLVETPLSTLEGHYAAGIKPKTIVEAISGLLGLTGIAIGAAQ